MTLASYYRWTLLLPLALPLLLAPGLYFVDRMGTAGQVLLVAIVGSPVYGAVPYVAFLLLLRRWMRGKPERRLRCAALLAPLLFAPLLAAWLLPVLWVRRDGFWSAAEATFGAFVPFGIVLGYVYVAMAEAGWAVLEARGRIEREAA